MKAILAIVLFLFVIEINAQNRGLDIDLEVQMKSKWCWAACAKMAIQFLPNSPSTTQCQIVEKYFQAIKSISTTVRCSTQTCSIQGNTYTNDFNYSLEYIQPFEGLHRVLSIMGYHSSIEFGPNFSWDEIVAEIESCRPLILFISQGLIHEPSHVLVVYGYRDGRANQTDNYLLVRDPWCSTGGYYEINFSNTQSSGSNLKLSGYQINLCKKGDLCEPCGEEQKARDISPLGAPSSMVSSEEEPEIIQVKILNNNKTKLHFHSDHFYDNEIHYKYYSSTNKAIEYERKENKEFEVSKRHLFLPAELKAFHKRDTFQLGYNSKNNKIKYTLITSPRPYSESFFSFKPPSNKIYYVSTEPYVNTKKANRVVIYPNIAYDERVFFHKLKQIRKGELLSSHKHKGK